MTSQRTTADAAEAYLRRRQRLLARLARVDAMLGRIEGGAGAERAALPLAGMAGMPAIVGDASQLAGGLKELRASLAEELEQL